MKIIISPAKKMATNCEELEYKELPAFLDKTQCILEVLQEKELDELKKMWKCNDKLTQMNYERIQKMELRQHLTPALLSYEGIQYQYMAPTVFEDKMLNYVQEHLRILSGFYGVLKPMDGVVPYRLEMQTKLSVAGSKNLYDYWGQALYESIIGNVVDNVMGNAMGNEESQVIVNLASKEYSTCVESYLKPTDRFVTCVFGEVVNGKVVQKGTYAKMARGEMVRYMAENQVQDVEDIKGFNRLGYCYSEEYSEEDVWVFVKL